MERKADFEIVGLKITVRLCCFDVDLAHLGIYAIRANSESKVD